MPTELQNRFAREAREKEELNRSCREFGKFYQETPAAFDDIYIHQSNPDEVCH